MHLYTYSSAYLLRYIDTWYEYSSDSCFYANPLSLRPSDPLAPKDNITHKIHNDAQTFTQDLSR